MAPTSSCSSLLGLFIVKFRINRTPCAGSVRKPNLPGDESVSLFLRFTIVLGFQQRSAEQVCFYRLRARVQQRIPTRCAPTSLYICGFYCKNRYFFIFFRILHVFCRKKVSLICSSVMDTDPRYLFKLFWRRYW